MESCVPGTEFLHLELHFCYKDIFRHPTQTNKQGGEEESKNTKQHRANNNFGMVRLDRFLLLSSYWFVTVQAFSPAQSVTSKHKQVGNASPLSGLNEDGTWNGEVVANTQGGTIQGCTIQPAKPDSLTEWELTIDGVEADLGRFSEAIYKKIIQDAKQQRFQGFRPGTMPPHIEPTYRAFAMDECARETVMEALQQNNIRPFESTRSEMFLKNFQIPAAKQKKSKKRKKKKIEADAAEDEVTETEPSWRSFETMKEAVDAGWQPGQSFSFVAVDIKGQKVKGPSETEGAKPLGLNY